MRNPWTIAAAAIVLCALIALAATGNGDRTTAVRFSIIAASLEDGPTLVRFDTTTGKAWQLLSVPVAGKAHVTGWNEIPDDPWSAAERLKTASPAK